MTRMSPRWRAGCFTGRGLCIYHCWLIRVRSDLAGFNVRRSVHVDNHFSKYWAKETMAPIV